MTCAIATVPRAAPGLDPAGTLRRIAGIIAGSLSCAWAGLQSVSRASMLEAARELRAGARNSAMRTRRLP